MNFFSMFEHPNVIIFHPLPYFDARNPKMKSILRTEIFLNKIFFVDYKIISEKKFCWESVGLHKFVQNPIPCIENR